MAAPLAERLRPQTLDDYIGQKHLVGPDAVLRKIRVVFLHLFYGDRRVSVKRLWRKSLPTGSKRRFTR